MKKQLFFSLMMFVQTLGWGDEAHGRLIESPNAIRIKGSETMEPLSHRWATAYRAKSPDITLAVSGGGSGNGIAALINGHVEIANTSRPLKSQEVRQMVRRSGGHQPVVYVVGFDAVSVLVHPLNPLNGISIQQLGKIYARNSTINHWEDLGVSVPGCEKHEIVRVSRKNNSGTHTFFRGAVFPRRQHFNINLAFVENSEAVVQRVAQTPCAIGYSGMGFVTATVKTLCLTRGKGPCVPPTPAFALDKSYPLTRPLYMTILGPPKEVVKDYLQWIVGPTGQDVLRKFGFVPIPKVKESE